MLKKQKLKDTDFLYVSTRLHSAEKDMITNDKLTRLIDAKDFDEALSMACDMYGVGTEAFGNNYGAMLSRELEKAYGFCTELIGGIIDMDEKPFSLLDPFRFMYDCQNLKSAIKCEALGKEYSSMLSTCGAVSADKLAYSINSRDFSAYPENMAKAAPVACEQLAATGDPQEVDLILDRAAFEDMIVCAENSGLEYLLKLIRTKTDSVNIITALRCIKQHKPRQYMQKLFVSGGTLDEDFFTENYDDTVAKLIGALAFTEYSDISKLSDSVSGITATDAEKLCSLIYLRKANAAASMPFGAELVVCYIVRKEYEIRNVRIVLAGKACGLSAEKIKERLMMNV